MASNDVVTSDNARLSSEENKLTDWKQEPSVTALKGDFLASQTSHDTQSQKITSWINLSKVEGSEKPKKQPGRSAVQPRLVRRQAEWRYSALTEPFLGSDKLFEVKPNTFEDKAGAVQNETLLNWQFRTKMDRVTFIDEYVRTVVDEGTAIIRVGWDRQTKKVTRSYPIWSYYAIDPNDQEALMTFKQSLDAKLADPRHFDENSPPEIKAAVEYFEKNQMPVTAVQTGTESREEDEVICNKPTAELVNYENFYLDPSCGSKIEDAKFAICSFETSKAQLQKQTGRYKNLDKIDWEAAGPISTEFHATASSDSSFQFTDSARKRMVAYEYWGFYDIVGTGDLTPIVATWIGNTMIRMEKNPYPDEAIPFVLVPYLPVKRSVYGETDAELLGDHQRIIGAVTRGMIDLLGRSANGQQGMAKGMLDPLNRRRYDAGANYEYNPSINPTNGVIEHKFPELPQSALQITQLMNQEAESLTGVKAFSGGMSGEAYGKVAAGIRGMLDAASKREMAILRRLSRGLVEVGKKFASMNAVFMTPVEVIRVTNEEFVTVKREELRGNYDLIVDISTAEVDDAQAQDLAFMLQTMGPNMDFSMTQMILAEIARLKRMPDLAKRIQMFQPQPDPLVQKQKELEVAKLEAEIAELQAQAELNRAKAREAASTADKADLDYVQEADGTKHRQDIEKTQAQAEANQDLEVTKALLQTHKPEEKKPDIEQAVGWNTLSRQSPVASTAGRDVLGEVDPAYSLSSRFYNPQLDPTTNPGVNL